MKLYRNTVLVCGCLAAGTFAISVLLQFVVCDWNANCVLIQNYCVGLACSSVLVIVPTLLQYEAEKKRAINELKDLLLDITLQVVLGSSDDLSERQYEMIANDLHDSCSKLLQFMTGYSTFLPKDRKTLIDKITPIALDFVIFVAKRSKESSVAAVRSISNSEKGKEIVRISLQFLDESVWYKIFREYVDGEHDEISD